eukprot:6799936-Alexandrium_andersonii.AAC.1
MRLSVVESDVACRFEGKLGSVSHDCADDEPSSLPPRSGVPVFIHRGRRAASSRVVGTGGAGLADARALRRPRSDWPSS